MLKLLLEKLYVTLENELENDRKNKTGNFDFFETHILKQSRFEKYEYVKVTGKTMKNYYDKHVLGKENKSKEPSSKLKNLISEYLGFKDYNDFVDFNQPENGTEIIDSVITEEESLIVPKNETKTVSIKTEEEPSKLIDPPINSMKKWKKIIALSSIPLLGLLYIPYQNAIINNSDCIVWTGNQYKKTACTTYKAINNKNLSINIDIVKKIEINQDTEFFKNGKAIVWYGKNNKGIIEYFNANIKHPETNVDLQKITRHFLNKHGLLNE